MKVTVDGEEITTTPRTISALLLERQQHHGLFCGIGVCFGCLVEVNGTPEVRACQRALAEGDDVRTHR
ncbi:proline dehydrogenase [Lentzea sp. NBRC 105346]|uniref:2Fe-2S iron-sulfur cluster-binding protein n=1 Tax=Lentzea sp. NBRC 105346 TaxID=3032205 RepID=UPI0024A3A8CF|nr:2Fe-2S iron-sulfur cluster-binding protein [Lentzea sp. NBRC 105346]GLZ35121.1 proline dehydrogenase [Lentzea sp. NBRC 105346]